MSVKTNPNFLFTNHQRNPYPIRCYASSMGFKSLSVIKSNAKYCAREPQRDEKNKQEYKFDSCGEWNNDFVALNGGGENEANQVLDDVNRNVVMI